MIEKIQEILREYKDDDSIELSEATNLNTDLGLSSMDYLSLIIDIEAAFNTKIPDSALKSFRTIGDLTEYISNVK